MSTTPALPRPAASQTFLWPLLARALMLVVGVGSVALVWWSLNRLPPLARQVRDKDLTRANLAAEVQQFEMNWNAEAAQILESRYQAAHERLFDGPEESQRWRTAFAGMGNALAFDTELQLAINPSAAPEHKLHQLVVTPATLRLQPAAEGKGLTNSPYERLLTLAASLAQTKRRVDLVELSVQSDSNSVAQARAELRLWSREKVNP